MLAALNSLHYIHHVACNNKTVEKKKQAGKKETDRAKYKKSATRKTFTQFDAENAEFSVMRTVASTLSMQISSRKSV